MLKLIHGADFHLDSPFSGLSPELAAQRRQEQRELLSALTELARARKADAILLSGDLLDSTFAFRETVQSLSAQLGGAGCPVFISPGNHDCFRSGSPYATAQWPENVHIFSTPQVESCPIPGTDWVVHGAAFPTPHLHRSPLEDFTAPEDGKFHIMTLHGDVEGNGDYAPISLEAIARSNLSYLALGHVHRFSGLNRQGSTFWAYPGCPEGRGFDEEGQKGVLYLELEGKNCQCEFVPLGTRRYETLTVDVTGQDDLLQAVRAALPGDTERDIYRILLTGTHPHAPDLARLEQALAPRFFSLTLRDLTTPPRALWARMEEDTLTGLFLREMAALCKEDPDNEILQLAVRYGLAALEGGEEVAP